LLIVIHRTAVLTVTEDSKLIRQVSIVAIGLHCLVNVKNCTVDNVQCKTGTTHRGSDRNDDMTSNIQYQLFKTKQKTCTNNTESLNWW